LKKLGYLGHEATASKHDVSVLQEIANPDFLMDVGDVGEGAPDCFGLGLPTSLLDVLCSISAPGWGAS
jgi:hypothetical protein